MDPMQIKFIGSGAAFTMDQYQSNMLVSDGAGSNLLIDCGSDARHALAAQHLTYRDVHAVYVSHLHADHVGGLEWLGFCTKFDPRCQKPALFISAALAGPLWNRVLAGGMESIQGEIADLDTYFEVRKITKNSSFAWGAAQFQVMQTVHIMNGYVIVPSFGLLITGPTGRKTFLTTDTQFAPAQIMDFYRQADRILQDCETAQFKSGVHAHFTELQQLPDDVRAKMWLYHFQDGARPDALAAGFAGYVVQGQVFDL
jgi:ribonuclease BN (tRNA processing enzyme)